MRTALILIFSVLMLTSSFGQSPPAKWQVATIMDMKAHPAAAGEDLPAIRYDVTVRVDKTEYVVLYVAPDATLKDVIEYHPGMDGLVWVGADTIRYNDMLGRTREVPIISRRAVPANSPEIKPDRKK